MRIEGEVLLSLDFMLEPVEGENRPDHRSVLTDRQQCVIRAGGVIAASLSPVAAEEALIEENRRRGYFLQDALRPGRRSCRTRPCTKRFPGSAEEILVRRRGLCPEEYSCQGDEDEK